MNSRVARAAMGTLLAFTAACSPAAAGVEREPAPSPEMPGAITSAINTLCDQVVHEYEMPDPALAECVARLGASIQTLDNRWPSGRMLGDVSAAQLTSWNMLEGWESLGLLNRGDATGGNVNESVMNALAAQKDLFLTTAPSLVFQ